MSDAATNHTPRIRRFLTPVGVEGEYFYSEGAVLEITPQKAQRILILMDQLRNLQTINPDVFKIESWDYLPEFIESIDEEENLALYETLQEMKGDFMEVDTLPEEDTPGVSWFATELGFMVISGVTGFEQPRVHWTAVIKHTDVTMNTEVFPRYVIEAIAEERDITHPG